MKQEFNWRDYDNYNEWLHDVLETLTESIEEKDKEIDRLNNIIKEVRKYIEYQLENLDFEEDTKAKMLGAMVLVLLDKEEE